MQSGNLIIARPRQNTPAKHNSRLETLRMKNFACTLMFVFAFAAALVPAQLIHAQDVPQADLSVNYSHFQVLKGYTISMDGSSASGSYNFNNWLGAVADFGGYHGYPSESLTGETFTAGPRFTWRHFFRVQPFAQALLGGSHFNLNSGGITGGGAEFAFDGGAGLDIALDHARRFSLRLQNDFFGVRSAGSNTICNRLSAGITFHFGRRS
jgi:hypothetical protein